MLRLMLRKSVQLHSILFITALTIAVSGCAGSQRTATGAVKFPLTNHQATTPIFIGTIDSNLFPKIPDNCPIHDFSCQASNSSGPVPDSVRTSYSNALRSRGIQVATKRPTVDTYYEVGARVQIKSAIPRPTTAPELTCDVDGAIIQRSANIPLKVISKHGIGLGPPPLGENLISLPTDKRAALVSKCLADTTELIQTKIAVGSPAAYPADQLNLKSQKPTLAEAHQKYSEKDRLSKPGDPIAIDATAGTDFQQSLIWVSYRLTPELPGSTISAFSVRTRIAVDNGGTKEDILKLQESKWFEEPYSKSIFGELSTGDIFIPSGNALSANPEAMTKASLFLFIEGGYVTADGKFGEFALYPPHEFTIDLVRP